MGTEYPPPVVLSMDVSGWDDSEYGILVHDQVKYLIIRVGAFDRSTLSMPLSSLPRFPQDNSWNLAERLVETRQSGRL